MKTNLSSITLPAQKKKHLKAGARCESLRRIAKTTALSAADLSEACSRSRSKWHFFALLFFIFLSEIANFDITPWILEVDLPVEPDMGLTRKANTVKHSWYCMS